MAGAGLLDDVGKAGGRLEIGNTGKNVDDWGKDLTDTLTQGQVKGDSTTAGVAGGLDRSTSRASVDTTKTTRSNLTINTNVTGSTKIDSPVENSFTSVTPNPKMMDDISPFPVSPSPASAGSIQKTPGGVYGNSPYPFSSADTKAYSGSFKEMNGDMMYSPSATSGRQGDVFTPDSAFPMGRIEDPFSPASFKGTDDLVEGGVKGGDDASSKSWYGSEKGARTTDDLVEGGVKGTDDLVEGGVKGTDDLVEGGVKGTDDTAEGAAKGADDAGKSPWYTPKGAKDKVVGAKDGLVDNMKNNPKKWIAGGLIAAGIIIGGAVGGTKKKGEDETEQAAQDPDDADKPKATEDGLDQTQNVQTPQQPAVGANGQQQMPPQGGAVNPQVLQALQQAMQSGTDSTQAIAGLLQQGANPQDIVNALVQMGAGTPQEMQQMVGQVMQMMQQQQMPQQGMPQQGMDQTGGGYLQQGADYNGVLGAINTYGQVL